MKRKTPQTHFTLEDTPRAKTYMENAPHCQLSGICNMDKMKKTDNIKYW